MFIAKATQQLFHLIPLLDKKFVRPISLQTKPFLTALQVDILGITDERKPTMTELSQTTLISKQQLTPLINKLVLEGLVQRGYDPLDRRIIQIHITPSGRDMLKQVKEEALNLLEKKLISLNHQDLTCLNQALTDLDRILHKIP